MIAADAQVGESVWKIPEIRQRVPKTPPFLARLLLMAIPQRAPAPDQNSPACVSKLQRGRSTLVAAGARELSFC